MMDQERIRTFAEAEKNCPKCRAVWASVEYQYASGYLAWTCRCGYWIRSESADTEPARPQ